MKQRDNGLARPRASVSSVFEKFGDARKERAPFKSVRSREMSWTQLRAHGFEDYVAVLGGLGELKLRPPVPPIAGLNRAALERSMNLTAPGGAH